MHYFFCIIALLAVNASLCCGVTTPNAPTVPFYHRPTLYILPGSSAPHGMFSGFFMVLGALEFLENNPGTGLWVNLNEGLYFDPDRGPNWWNYYFDPILFPCSRMEKMVTHHYQIEETSEYAYFTLFNMPRERANYLVKKYICVKPHIMQEVERFVQKRFEERYVIGIHYRGTDKVTLEVSRVDYETMAEAIDEAIENIPLGMQDNYCLFVATDEIYFLIYILSKYDCPVFYTNSRRSTPEEPVHFLQFNNYEKGKEALVDCLLLSRCDTLIRTESNLSVAAGFFNPTLPIRYIKTRYYSDQLEQRSNTPQPQ